MIQLGFEIRMDLSPPKRDTSLRRRLKSYWYLLLVLDGYLLPVFTGVAINLVSLSWSRQLFEISALVMTVFTVSGSIKNSHECRNILSFEQNFTKHQHINCKMGKETTFFVHRIVEFLNVLCIISIFSVSNLFLTHSDCHC